MKNNKKKIGIIYPFVGLYNLEKIKLINYNLNYNNIIEIIKQIIIQLKNLENIIHCDLKSSNVVINNIIKPTIIDYGLINNVNIRESILTTIYITSPESLLLQDQYINIINNNINLSKHDNYGLFTIIIDLFMKNNLTYWNIIYKYLCNYLGFNDKLLHNQQLSYIYVYCWYRFCHKNIDNICDIYKKLINNIIDYHIIHYKINLEKINFLLFNDFFDLFILSNLDLNKIDVNNIILLKDFLINLINFNFNLRYNFDQLLNHNFIHS